MSGGSSASAIDTWIASQLTGDDESFAEIPDGMKLPLEDLLGPSAIIPNLRSKDPIAVIEELAARAMSNGWLTDKPWFVGAVVERESLASTAMEGGVAFLHTRAKDKGKIAKPFIICGRSWEGIKFGAPDGKPTYLFFLLGLKYDKLHLPILGRLARALRNPATIARLRALSSTDQIRALLLKEDAKVRAGIEPVVQPESTHPKLDRTLRLRAIRRLGQLRRTAQDPEPAKGKRGSRAKPKAAKTAAKPKPAKARRPSRRRRSPGGREAEGRPSPRPPPRGAKSKKR